MKYLIKKDTPTKENKKHWQFCVGSGRAVLALRTDYLNQLKYIHDELGIERVRFHGIFNDEMNTLQNLADMFQVEGAEQYQETNFHACGVVYDNVIAAGMKPFVELSFMPRLLAKNERKSNFFYHPNICPPGDYVKWQTYIKLFIRYLQRRYGVEEVRTWYFEVWNEPDLVLFFSEDRDSYFELYRNTVAAIKEVDEKLMVGGPATSGSKWVKAFIDYCEKNDIPVDFVTTHQYAGDPIGGVEDQGDINEPEEIGKKKPVIDGYKKFLERIGKNLKNAKDNSMLEGLRAIQPDKSEIEDIPSDIFRNNSLKVKEQAGKYPIIYTEWNENSTFSAYTNDTRKAAAYDVRAALQVDDIVFGSSLWCFSDIFEEFHQFSQEFHGGFGMLSLNGIPKPTFYGFKMLSMTGERRLILPEEALDGEIGIAAFKKLKEREYAKIDGEKEEIEEMQILMLRQKMKNLNLPKEAVEISVEIKQEPQKVVLYRIDEEHCNPLRIWEKMGISEELNPKEVEYIKDKSSMIEEKCMYTYEDEYITIHAELGVNDIYFVRIFI